MKMSPFAIHVVADLVGDEMLVEDESVIPGELRKDFRSIIWCEL